MRDDLKIALQALAPTAVIVVVVALLSVFVCPYLVSPKEKEYPSVPEGDLQLVAMHQYQGVYLLKYRDEAEKVTIYVARTKKDDGGTAAKIMIHDTK